MSKRVLQLPWFAILLAAVAVAVCVRLGFWQLDRAQTKEQWQQELTQRQQEGEQSVGLLLTMADPGNYPVRVRGIPDNSHTILLDNRIHQSVAGYHVLTPVLTESGHWLLLNRGWWPRGPSRDQLPDIPPLPPRVDVAGRTYVHSDKVFTLADDDLTKPQWPLRVQRVDMASLGRALDVELAPFEVRAEPGADLEAGEEQMVRQWSGTMMTPERHRAYAVQWFAMAGAVVLLMLLAAIRQRHQSDREMDA